MLKLSLAIPTPEIRSTPPLALLQGDLVTRLERAAELGYEGVELMVARPKELDPQAIAAEARARGMEISAIASGAIFMEEGLSLLNADPRVMERAASRLLELMDFAAGAGAPLVTIGGFRGRLAWAGGFEARPAFVETLRQAARRARSLKVRLVIEPLNRYETDLVLDVKQGLALLEEVGQPELGLLLDTFHMNIEEASFSESVSRADGRLWHVHLGDSNRLPPGQGHLDFAEVLRALQEVGYSGYLSAELLPLPDPDQAAAQTIAYMRSLIRPSG